MKQRPLFFLPAALRLYNQFDFSVSGLAEAAKEVFADRPADVKLGRGSIDNVLKLTPVTHITARRFIEVMNVAVEAQDGFRDAQPLAEDQIVAAVFRVPNAAKLFDAVGAANGDLARRAGLSEALAANIRRGGRTNLAAALRLREALQAMAAAKNLDASGQAGAAIFGELSRFISEDLQSPLAIFKQDDGRAMIADGDLALAPRDGHPWAIDAATVA